MRKITGKTSIHSHGSSESRAVTGRADAAQGPIGYEKPKMTEEQHSNRQVPPGRTWESPRRPNEPRKGN
jgi:hypothetical protein